MSQREHIVVGISGGVDSATAALTLLREGHEVAGLFMRNWDDPEDPGYCSIPYDQEAAEAVCTHLGIPLYRVDFTAEYWHRVFEHFLNEYAAGRTPNPDILCNREIKFGTFLQHARTLGADRIATGHYARIGPGPDGPHLLRGSDPGKDQSYFLHAIDRTALDMARFPLGDLTKATVRERARAAGLPNHDRRDSTGICFIGEREFREFLKTYLPAQPGPMVDTEGVELGRHQGLMYYTLGQRQGLGIGGGKDRSGAPWYVVDKDLQRNRLIVGEGHDHPRLQCQHLTTEPPHWLTAAPTASLRCQAQVRYRQTAVPCTVEPAADTLTVIFDEPVRAATPGQSVVLYDGETCLGGAVIAATTPLDTQPASPIKATS